MKELYTVTSRIRSMWAWLRRSAPGRRGIIRIDDYGHLSGGRFVGRGDNGKPIVTRARGDTRSGLNG